MLYTLTNCELILQDQWNSGCKILTSIVTDRSVEKVSAKVLPFALPDINGEVPQGKHRS
jgi:hypothetical protein